MLKITSIKIKLLIMVNAIIISIAALRLIFMQRAHHYTQAYGPTISDMALSVLYKHIIKEEIFTFAVILLLISVSSIIFSRHILKSVGILKNTAKKIMEGDYSARSNIKNDNEIGMLAQAFDKMAESIDNWGKESAGIIASLSHEIKTPLNVIFSSVQLIDSYRNNLDPPEYKKKVPTQINLIRQNCYRMLRLINNLLDICRHDSGYLKAKLVNYDLVELAREITLSVKKYAESKRINLIFDSGMESQIIACDPDMIERILLNLISNAVKFTDKNGTISVILAKDKDNIFLTVKDTGIGIPEDKLNRIFDIFNKDETLVRNKEGTGLGLYLVKAFVEAHGGKISVKSSKDNGSEFCVALPIRIIDQDSYLPVHEPQGEYGHIMSYNGVHRVHIEFSDIYSGFDKEQENT